jgi:hypothetical protein
MILQAHFANHMFTAWFATKPFGEVFDTYCAFMVGVWWLIWAAGLQVGLLTDRAFERIEKIQRYVDNEKTSIPG